MSVTSASIEIDALFRGLSVCKTSSVDIGWEGFVIERRLVYAGEQPEDSVDHHFIAQFNAGPIRGERANLQGRFVPFTKYPEMLSMVVPGHLASLRSYDDIQIVVCALHPSFVNKVEIELDRRPAGSAYDQSSFYDVGLGYLMSLLTMESEEGGPRGRLYAESIVQALTVRFLYLSHGQKTPLTPSASALPRHLLRRVLDLMHAHLASDLSLNALAAETNYSRTHFLRMFQAATGKTPHRYLLDLRLEDARRRMNNSSMSLVEIACASGFSSHSHFTRVFRQRFGVTPSRYRRTVSN